VSGIGGLFFRARDPESLGKWYRNHLGVDPVPADYDQSPRAAGSRPVRICAPPRRHQVFR